MGSEATFECYPINLLYTRFIEGWSVPIMSNTKIQCYIRVRNSKKSYKCNLFAFVFTYFLPLSLLHELVNISVCTRIVSVQPILIEIIERFYMLRGFTCKWCIYLIYIIYIHIDIVLVAKARIVDQSSFDGQPFSWHHCATINRRYIHMTAFLHPMDSHFLDTTVLQSSDHAL